jgi:hypothetical protein
LANVQLMPPPGVVIACVGMVANRPWTWRSIAATSYSSPGCGTGSPSWRKIFSNADPGPNGESPNGSSAEGVSPSSGRLLMDVERTRVRHDEDRDGRLG